MDKETEAGDGDLREGDRVTDHKMGIRIPYRSNLLTHLLRDCFENDKHMV